MRPSLIALALFLAGPAWADAPSPYAELAGRPIRALSPEQQADLLAGRGMGLALAAELNGWPGPVHVLELADDLGLTPEQRAATEALVAAMQAAARRLGARLVAEEQALDHAFRERGITPAGLAGHTARIGALQGELRAVHLHAHLDQAAILGPEQLAAYERLRGYAAAAARQPAEGGGRHHGHPRP